MRILSIDAWADCCGCDHSEDGEEACWTWNNWFPLEKRAEKIPETVEEFGALLDAIPSRFKPENYELDDDQYNVVLLEKKTRKPLYAVEYGAANDILDQESRVSK